LKKYFPKKWIAKYHPDRLKKGEIYVYNLIKGHEHHLLKPGDKVKLVKLLPDAAFHVEVETLDERYSGKIHVLCLMLDRV